MLITTEQIMALKPCPDYSRSRVEALFPAGLETTREADVQTLLDLPRDYTRWFISELLPVEKRVAWARACAVRAASYASLAAGSASAGSASAGSADYADYAADYAAAASRYATDASRYAASSAYYATAASRYATAASRYASYASAASRYAYAASAGGGDANSYTEHETAIRHGLALLGDKQ